MERSPFRKVLRRSCRYELCLQCLRTIQRSVGKQARPYNASRAQMTELVREVFGEGTFTACAQQLEHDKSGGDGDGGEVRFHLQVKLLDAEGLFDVSYRKYAHCRLWVNESDGNTSEVSKRKWLPESTIELSAEVREPSKSSLVLEVLAKEPQNAWDAVRMLARPTSLSTLIESLRQLFSHYFKAQSALKLVGRLEKPLQEIPCVGVEEWYALKDSSGRNVDTKVQLSVTYHTVTTADISVLERIREHYALSFVFLEHNVENTAEDSVARWTKWADCVGRRGLTLLRQHAMQNNMQDVEAHCCHLQAVTEHRMKVNTQISFVVMYLLLKELQLELGSTRHRFVSDALDQLIQGLSEHINAQLANLHNQYYLEFELHVTDLSGALSVCALMEKMSSMPIVESARVALQKNEREWYQQLAEKWDENTTLSIVAATLEEIRSHQQKANRLFQQSWNETYTNIVMHQLDDFLVTYLRPWVTRQVDGVIASLHGEEEEKTLASIEAFLVIKTFLEEIFAMLNVDPDVLKVERYREWFGARVVERWFNLASRASEVVVEFAAADDLAPLNANVKYSSSFVKTADAINASVVSIWVLLEWSEHACSFAFVECVQQWVTVYAAAIERKIEDERGSQNAASGSGCAVPARLCVAVNDLMGILAYVQQIRSKIIDTYVGSGEGLSRFADVDIKVHSTLAVVGASKDRLLEIIVHRLLPGVEPRLEKVLRAQTTMAQEADVDGLLRSVMACVTSLRVNLEAEAFEAVLGSLWAKMTTLLKQAISRLRTRCGVDARAYSTSYLGLSVLIQHLPKCFIIKDSGGLSPAAMAADVSARLRELKEVFRDQHGAGDV
ncbi:BAI1-associated protein 3-like [Dermacentor albipictus]|uniref:BAI1-associated protein 3-like n=1 Tax=Dermacentor albipictus TaxID=60249 RepID=UPI0031FE3877